MAGRRMRNIDWARELLPLVERYKGRKHPLDYKSCYQLVVMVILSARDSDKHINTITPPFFKAFPSMKKLAKAKEGFTEISQQGSERQKQDRMVNGAGKESRHRREYS